MLKQLKIAVGAVEKSDFRPKFGLKNLKKIENLYHRQIWQTSQKFHRNRQHEHILCSQKLKQDDFFWVLGDEVVNGLDSV